MSNKEIEWLNAAMKQTWYKRLYESYLAVRLRLEGHTFEEIGNLLSRARQTGVWHQHERACDQRDTKKDELQFYQSHVYACQRRRGRSCIFQKAHLCSAQETG